MGVRLFTKRQSLFKFHQIFSIAFSVTEPHPGSYLPFICSIFLLSPKLGRFLISLIFYDFDL